VADLGDAPVNPINIDISVALIEEHFAKLHEAGIRPLSVGGDHTIPLPILRGITTPKNPVGVIQFDAHMDTLDELLGSRVNHGTMMRRATEEGLIDPKRVVQIGYRGSRYSDDDLKYSYDTGYTVITIDEYEEMGREKAIDIIKKTVAGGPLYITLDIDAIDPAYASGTGTLEIGGLLPRDVQMIIRALADLDIIGGDVSEVSPPLDPTAVTCNTAANLMFEILCVMALSINRRAS
jgi:guanidinopropionase